MTQLSLTLLRLGYLVLLWTLVLSVIAVMRSDLYGTRVAKRGKGLTRKRQVDARAEKRPAPSRAATGIRPGAIAPNEKPSARLVVVAGPLKGATVPLGSAPVLVGRAASCTLVVEDDYLSARHCRIYYAEGKWLVEDLGSTNGTFLDNRRVDDPVPVDAGEQIRIGTTVMEIRA